MGQRNFKKLLEFNSFSEIFYCGMTRLRKKSMNYCGLYRYVKAIKPKKVVRQSFFKNHLKFQYSIKFFTATWPNAGTNNRKFLENIFTQKLL